MGARWGEALPRAHFGHTALLGWTKIRGCPGPSGRGVSWGLGLAAWLDWSGLMGRLAWWPEWLDWNLGGSVLG